MRNLILLSLDCVRADSLKAYRRPCAGGRLLRGLGLRRSLTPQLDAIASGGTSVRGVFSVAPVTPPAHASLFTGCYPRRHGVRLPVGQRMDPGVPTLAERLAEAGYATAAFPGAFVINSSTGILRGFQFADDVTEGRWSSRGGHWRMGHLVLESFAEWLGGREGGRPFFAFLHLFDAHHEKELEWTAGLSWDAGYRERLRRLDAEVIGGLLTLLERTGLRGSTGLVVTSDHGESLGEFGEQGHGASLHDGVLNTPLLVSAPWEPARGVAAGGVARSIDIMPTTLSLLGIEPPDGIDGVDFSAALRGKEEFPELEAYSECSPLQLFEGAPSAVTAFGGVEMASLRTARWRYVETMGGERRLFPVVRGLQRTADAAQRHPDVAESMSGRLTALGTWERPSVHGESLPVEHGTLRKLSELGYL